MRVLVFAAIATFLSVISADVRADLGPPPSCPPGTYHAYLYGHRCVPNGSHLERDPEGGVKIVKDGATLDAPPKPTFVTPPKSPPKVDPSDPLSGSLDSPATRPTTSAIAAPVESASTAPANSVMATPAQSATIALASSAAAPTPAIMPPADASANAPPSPTSAGGCSCGVPAAPEERIGFVLIIATALFALRRRKRQDRLSR
ncbi:MAG TPA: MYXO-CTERM sorting domain-containing protein [Polyangium sp.]|nr:MYXO-CTERM sorting domain-containing protein [Polyangium sp.]